MLERIITWSLDNRPLVLLAALALAGTGAFSLSRTPLDAIPDLSDVQVVLYTEYPGQAPRIVEDQVTYPLSVQMLSVPYATDVRGYSFFGYSLVYVLFEDGTDLYWARSRVIESLSQAAARLPDNVTPALGPDAPGVGWAFLHALKSDRHDLSELRSLQDWFLKYELSAVPGVADPNRLRAFGISAARIREAVRQSNSDAGGIVRSSALSGQLQLSAVAGVDRLAAGGAALGAAGDRARVRRSRLTHCPCRSSRSPPPAVSSTSRVSLCVLKRL